MKSDHPDNDHYPIAVAAAGVLLAHEIEQLETNTTRKGKMRAVIGKKRTFFYETFARRSSQNDWAGELKNITRNSVSKKEAVKFLIDLAFTNPFAPYELTFKPKALQSGIEKVGGFFGIGPDKIESIFATQKDAFKAHRRVDYGTIAVVSIAGLALVAVGAWAAAPYIGGAIGTAAGLTGAAATAHGLAILGGGSLAIGGFGMAGGTWLIVGSAVLIAGASGGATLLAIGPAAAKLELVKLQVTFKEVFLETPELAKQAILSLRGHQKEIEETLEQERCLNDKGARRIKDAEQTLHAIIAAASWMEKKLAK